MLRRISAILLCGLSAALLLCAESVVPAQTKKDDLNKQIQDLKKKLADRDQTIAQLNTKITANTKALKDKDDLIKTLQSNDLSKDVTALRKRVRDLETFKKAPYIHATLLKLKKSDKAQVQKVFDEAFKTIAKIDGVRGMWIGKPAEEATPDLVNKDYQLALIVALDNAEGLKAYLDDPLYKKFTDKLADYWEKPIVYDIQRDLDAEKKSEAKVKKDPKPKETP